jgi:hypothetical protein
MVHSDHSSSIILFGSFNLTLILFGIELGQWFTRIRVLLLSYSGLLT